MNVYRLTIILSFQLPIQRLRLTRLMSGKGQNESFLENPSQYSFVGDNRFDLHFRNQLCPFGKSA